MKWIEVALNTVTGAWWYYLDWNSSRYI